MPAPLCYIFADSDPTGRNFCCLSTVSLFYQGVCGIRRARRKRPREDRTPHYRRNRQIRVPEVVLIDHNNVNHGKVDTRDALKMAIDAELDLVEVAPRQRPPVARIIDYSKFIYEQQKKNKEARKNQKKIEVKTIKLKLKTSEFHRDIQVNKRARRWLTEGKKVKVSIRFYGREITYPELGRKIMDGVSEELKEVGIIESRPQFEGRTMIMLLAPNPAYKPPEKEEPEEEIDDALIASIEDDNDDDDQSEENDSDSDTTEVAADETAEHDKDVQEDLSADESADTEDATDTDDVSDEEAVSSEDDAAEG